MVNGRKVLFLPTSLLITRVFRLVLFHPPAPQEVEIRSGLLYSKVNLPDDIKPKENAQ